QHVGLLEIIDYVEWFTERLPRTLMRSVAGSRLELIAFRFSKFLVAQDRVNLSRQCRRTNGFGKDGQAGAASFGLVSNGNLKLRTEFAPSARPPVISHGLGAVGIIKTQDGCLGEYVGCAETGRMQTIAFNFRRPAFVALHDQTE